jgi:omega-amidase
MGIFTAGLIQMLVADDKAENVEKAVSMIARAARMGAELVVLPEMFSCPYETGNFPVYAEKAGGATWRALSGAAAENGVFLIGGSIPEADEAGRVYNTCFSFDRRGGQIGRHRKMHLFDVNIAGGQVFMESETLTAGGEATVFDTGFGRVGTAICYDIRFPELFRLMALRGATVMAVPAAFNMTTGPAHWEITFRARALDNQAFLLGAAPARNTRASYVAYGNSIAVSPWGDVLGRLDEKEGILLAEIDTSRLDAARGGLPLLRHRRTDVYGEPGAAR